MMALTVHILLYPEEDRYVGHCLEFDLVAQGTSALEAFKNVLDAIEVQASFAREIGDWSLLFVPAPAEYWRLLAAAESYHPSANGWHLPAVVSGVECALVKA